MESITAKIRDFFFGGGIDGIKHAVVVKWLILNGDEHIRDQKSLLIVSANGKVPVFGLIKNISCML